MSLKGPGGSEVHFPFLFFSDRGDCQLGTIFFIPKTVPGPGTVYGMKKIVPSQSYCIFKSQNYIQLHCGCELPEL